MSKKILVTGADGFIGSHLCELLVEQGYQVRALAQYNSFNSRGWLDKSDVQNHIEILSGDVRDPFFCARIVKGVDAILHLASLIAIPYSYHAPHSYVETNIMGTLNICQAALNEGVDKVVHTSTSETYGSALYVPIDERHPMQPQSPYSASKISADAMARSYYYSFDLPLVVARPFNAFGPRQSARAIIPTIITQMLAGRETIKLGDLSPTRDFTFVKDTCRGFLSLLESDDPAMHGEVFNIGTGVEVTMREVFDLIKDITGSRSEYRMDEQRLRPKKSEVTRLCCDNRKLMEATGFKTKYDLREGLAQTVEWFSQRQGLNEYRPDEYNV